MTYRIAKQFRFSASHVLVGLRDDHPCGRLHGHNYTVEIAVESDDVDSRGFVVDFADLDPVRTWIDESLDHRHLNDVLPGQPSAELLAKHILDWCERELPFPVSGVRVWETPSSSAELTR